MLKKFSIASLAVCAVVAAQADPIQIKGEISNHVDPVTIQPVPPEGTLRPLRYQPGGAYDASRVETKLNVDIKDSTGAVRFIRDNSDPNTVTKAYLIKNADPFVLRGILMSIVSAGISGSPVAVDTITYQDGLGILLVSAEEYRFKDVGNGMSIDEMVARLDKKGLPNSSGTIDMAYFPKYNKAEALLSMMMESGIGFTGASMTVKALTYDPNGLHVPSEKLNYALLDKQLNSIVMTAPGYDMAEALRFLKEVDTPSGEIQLNYRVVEVYAENDQKLGLDFQSWKNNDGIDLFTVGGRYGVNNWNHTLHPNLGSTNASYFNFNPKWNTKYIDFLTTCGKANVVSSGRLVVADGGSATLTVADDLFKMAIRKLEPKTAWDMTPKPHDYEENNYAKNIRSLIDAGIKSLFEGIKTQEGNSQTVDYAGNHLFVLSVAGDVHSSASNLDVYLNSTSLIGWDGSGTPRLSTSDYATKIQLGSGKTDFVIGGITKTSVVRSVSGVPFLKDLPVLGWLFSTETDSVKKSQFVVIVSAEVVKPASTLSEADKLQKKTITDKVEKSVQNPASTIGFQQLLLDDSDK
ncbi:MAG: hypothetical protein MJ033_05580 [Victivallaceae bacterium]|nr:hypothetical protein [Victivallaceae bacterium]